MPIYDTNAWSADTSSSGWCGSQRRLRWWCASCQPEPATVAVAVRGQLHETRRLHRAQGRKLAQGDQEQKHAEMEAIVHHHNEHEHSALRFTQRRDWD